MSTSPEQGGSQSAQHKKCGSPVFYERVLKDPVKGTAAVLTFLLTAAGVYFGWRALDPPTSSTEWVQQADAVCERDGGDMMVPLSQGVAALSQLTNLLAQGNPQAVPLTE